MIKPVEVFDSRHPDYIVVRALVVLISNFYVERVSGPANAGRTFTRRIRGLQQPGPTSPAAELLAIYNHKTQAWRVAGRGAWINDDEEIFSVSIGPNDRDNDIEARARAVINELKTHSTRKESR